MNAITHFSMSTIVGHARLKIKVCSSADSRIYPAYFYVCGNVVNYEIN